jgi:hypothetical protein
LRQSDGRVASDPERPRFDAHQNAARMNRLLCWLISIAVCGCASGRSSRIRGCTHDARRPSCFRRVPRRSRRAAFALFASVASLGLTVVITQIGLRAWNMNPDIAQALIGAALLSSLLNPTLAGVLLSRVYTPAARPSSEGYP